MAIDYEQYRKSPAAEKQTILSQTIGRLDAHLQLGPTLVNTDQFFRDVYLLKQTGFFNREPNKETYVRQMAANPKIRGDFVNRLKSQDAASESKEVLATLEMGRTFEYNQEAPFGVVFGKLRLRHEQLIAEAEEKRKAEEEIRKAEAAARRQAKNSWPPPESNIGKSLEWVEAQRTIAKLWKEKSRSLPQGLESEKPGADMLYFTTGFNLLKNEILRVSPNGLELRAMLEYLMPQMWRTPGILERFLKKMTPNKQTKPTNLAGLDTLSKAFYIPVSLQGLTQPLNQEQAKQIDNIYRAFTRSMHPDIAQWPERSKSMEGYVDTFYKSFTSSWQPVRELITGNKSAH